LGVKITTVLKKMPSPFLGGDNTKKLKAVFGETEAHDLPSVK
jgi:hypothetical protein